MITNAVSVSAATDDPNSANNVATTVTPVQEPYGINIVRNADAESVSIPIFTWDGFRIDGQQVGLGFSLVPGWYVTSNLTVQSYGSSADLPSEDSPGPGDRGANFFAGRWAPSTADQKCDLSWIAAAVDSGGVGYSMSGYLGGAASPSARAYFQVQFFNFIGTPLGNVLLGPVTSEDRANATALLERSAVGFLPRQTRSVQFTVVTVGEVSGWGLADNLSFVLRPPDAPLLEIMPVAPDQLRLSWSTNIPGFLAQSSSTLLPQSWTTMTTDVAVSGDRFTVLLRRSATSEYFRLRKP